MLPEAYEEGGDFAGLYTLLGFLASLFVKLTMEMHPEAHGTVCESVSLPHSPFNAQHTNSFLHSFNFFIL